VTGPILTPAERRFIARARRAVMATRSPDERPRLVPICFVLDPEDDPLGRPRLYTPLDEKPKRVADPRLLARVQDLLILPEVTVLVDRWSEDWSRLAWIRLYGTGEVLEPQPHEAEEHARAVAALRQKYPQYRQQALDERPVIRITVLEARRWGSFT
jgi:PPOX class probable F420-dependent enzyme